MFFHYSKMRAGDFHSTHCVNCRRVNCRHLQKCPLIYCPHLCGMRFHQCKEGEHQISCSRFRRPCINALYGCKQELNTEQLRNHLPRCPASTVVCTMEWNRTPLRQSLDVRNQLASSSPYGGHDHTGGGGGGDPVSVSNFNLIVTLKDQHALFQKATKSQLISAYAEEIIKPLDATDTAVPTAKISALSALDNGRTDEADANEVDANASSAISQPDKQLRTLPASFYKYNFCGRIVNGVHRRERPTYVESSCGTDDDGGGGGRETEPPQPGGGRRRRWYQDLYPFVRVDYAEHYQCVLLSVIQNENFYARAQVSETWIPNHGMCTESTQTYPCDILGIDVVKLLQPLAEDFTADDATTVADDAAEAYVSKKAHNPKFTSQLVLNTTMECQSRVVTNTDNMFSYMCGQLFRRDQFSWHYKNTHCDFYAGLNNWIEELCPYNQFGCTFRRHRHRPHSEQHELGFDNDRSCVLVRRKTKRESPPTNACILDLPVEMIEAIVSHLDSYSLGQLMETSKFMRAVTLNFLKSRGIVDVVWKRNEKYGTWRIKGHRWLFGNAMAPIRRWQMNSEASLANHISCECEYARRSYPRDYYDRLTSFPVLLEGVVSKVVN